MKKTILKKGDLVICCQITGDYYHNPRVGEIYKIDSSNDDAEVDFNNDGWFWVYDHNIDRLMDFRIRDFKPCGPSIEYED